MPSNCGDCKACHKGRQEREFHCICEGSSSGGLRFRVVVMQRELDQVACDGSVPSEGNVSLSLT